MKTIEISEIQKNLNFNIDYFFCSASFEERCYTIAEQLDFSKIENTILCINKDQAPTFKKYDVKLVEIIKKGKEYKVLEQDSENPIKNVQELVNVFDKIDDIVKKVFVIDISTFTHETLLVLFRLIKLKSIPSENIHYLYNNASKYSFNEDNIERKWLSVGNKEIRSVFGYSGFMSPLKKNALIVLVGFEPERTKKLIETYEPSVVSLGISKDLCSDDKSTVELNKLKHDELKTEFKDSRIFEFSVLCPYETQKAISDEVAKFKDYNIIIAPMNNKISTIGVASFAIINPDVQLCYVPAEYYNIEGYSKPGSKCMIFQMD